MFKITDNELCEGLLGSTGWIIFFYYLRSNMDWPTPIEGFVAWILLWFLRKIGMHLYKDLKKMKKLQDNTFSL